MEVKSNQEYALHEKRSFPLRKTLTEEIFNGKLHFLCSDDCNGMFQSLN